MIIEGLLTVIKNLLSTLLIIDIPNLPTEVSNYINDMFTYISAGAGILANYTPLSYLLTLFFLILAVDVGIALYHFVMWIIRKIPMLGMS